MVATAGGVAFALAPLAAACCLVLWLVSFAAFRYASVSSIVAAIALPVLCLAFGASWPVVAFTSVAAVGVLALHRHNIRRLLAGTEPRFSRPRPGDVDCVAVARRGSGRGRSSEAGVAVIGSRCAPLLCSSRRARSSPRSRGRRALRRGAGRPDRQDRAGDRHRPVDPCRLCVIPSDGADRPPSCRPAICADVDEIAAWWRCQDPEREPRFDRAAFPCGRRRTSSTYGCPTARRRSGPTTCASSASRRGRVAPGAPYAKQLVYYDGPTDDASSAARAAGAPTARASRSSISRLHGRSDRGRSRLTSCCTPSAPSPRTGRRSACPDSRGHPCDSEADILYPYAPTARAHALASTSAATTTTARRALARRAGLAVAAPRQPPGAVALASPGAARSRATCRGSTARRAARPTGTRAAVVLDALPAAGQRFVRWSGACTGRDRCYVALAAAQSVTALFAPRALAAHVVVSGAGGAGGRASCSIGRCVRISARPTCRFVCAATAAKGWRFAGWTRGLSRPRGVCTVPMTKATSSAAASSGADA